MTDILDAVWDKLQAEIAAVRQEAREASVRTERAEFTDGIPAYAFADLPTVGLADGSAGSYITILWVSDGRKSGESAGNGTGVLAIYDAASGDWLRVGADYDVVTI